MCAAPTAFPFSTSDDLRRLLSAREGTLDQVRFASLMMAMHVHERTGVLELRRNALEKQIIFEDGSPVDCRSNIATESLGRFLVSAGKLSESDYRSALAASVSHSVPIEDILVERKILGASEVFRLLQQSLGRRLLDPFTWRDGSWRITAELPTVDTALRVNVAQLVLTGVTKLEPFERLEEVLAPMQGETLMVASSPLVAAGDVRMSADQRRTADRFARGASLRSVAESTDSGDEELIRTTAALLTIGVLKVHDPRVAAVPKLELVERHTAPHEQPRVEPVSSAALPPVDTERLMTAFLSYRRKDAFELFDLPDDASIRRINEAFVEHVEIFRPERYPATEGLREKAQEILLAGARAYAELADPDRRNALLERRRGRSEAAATPPPEPKKTVIDPEELYAEGRRAADGGKMREALSYFEMAADCDAQNGVYAAELAFCRFQLLISPAQQTLKQLKNAIRIDPRCGLAYLYTARVHSTVGNHVEAEAYLNRAAELMPRDPRVPAAMRLLRSAAGR